MARRRTHNQLTLEPPSEIPTRTLQEEVEGAFLEYAMSVIVQRALPDVRDGLKPVHRRILWAMHDANLRPDRPFVKCARVVGEVMANYHPHGDSAIYEALVRMGQTFSLTGPLIDKHGNFGSPSDPPAASRYTECRLSALAMELLAGIDEGTVDSEPNYDASRTEPVVLPARFPNLLVNGAQGIAVGMATNIPPHNLAEVCNAAVKLIDKPDVTLSELMRIVKGPDFPTGGLIMGDDGIKDAFRTGRGTIRVRAVHEIEELPRRGGQAIVLTEVPFQTSVDAISGKLTELVLAGKVDGVRDIRNESGQGKTRLVIELRPDTNPQIVLNNLFKHTAAQSTFSVNMVALVDDVPRTVTLAEALQHWLDHQVVVVTRRSQFRLQKAQDRLHIVEGLVKALDLIDAIVKAIRESLDRAAARLALMDKRFGFSEIQANHILDMPLGRLTRLGREELDKERKELAATVKQLRGILSKRDVLMSVIREELVAIRDAHKAPRRTQIMSDDTGTLDVVALVEDEPYVVTVTARGYVRAVPARTRKSLTANPGERDAIAQVIDTTALSGLLFFTDRGRAYRATVHELPKEKLSAAQNLFQFGDGEKVVAVLDARMHQEHPNVVFVTATGGVKRTALSEFAEASGRQNGIVAMKLATEERVVAVFPGWDDYELLLVTSNGQAIRFAEDDVRPVGRSAGGVRGIRVKGDDRVIGGCAAADGELVVIATVQGFAKRTEVDEFPVQTRGGSGLKAAKIDKARGKLVAVTAAADTLAFLAADACLVVPGQGVRAASRDGGGSKVCPAGLQRVVAVAPPRDDA
ncbi:MAG: DNA topoisomerase 4 subunit A [Actinomycetota bacterium]|nr:DNA topoisomerase 4 subunit A [Actinomycetota bacterium]